MQLLEDVKCIKLEYISLQTRYRAQLNERATFESDTCLQLWRVLSNIFHTNNCVRLALKFFRGLIIYVMTTPRLCISELVLSAVVSSDHSLGLFNRLLFTSIYCIVYLVQILTYLHQQYLFQIVKACIMYK